MVLCGAEQRVSPDRRKGPDSGRGRPANPLASRPGDGHSPSPEVLPQQTGNPRGRFAECLGRHQAAKGPHRGPALGQEFASSLKGSRVCRRSRIWLLNFTQSEVAPEFL